MPSRTIVLLVFAAIHAVDAQTSRPSSTTVADIEQFIQRLVETRELPGAVLLLARDGRVVSERAFGDADVESHRPMRTDTLFRMASAAKIATTVGVLILQDDGRLSLDDPLERHLPEFRNARVLSADGSTRPASRSLTVRDLLRHTSGYGYGNDDRQRERYRDAGLMPKTSESSWAHAFTLNEWAKRMAAVPLASDPGSKFEYGLGADLAGALIERVSENSLDLFLQQRVFGPLGMNDTAFVVDASQASRLSSVYRIDNGRLSRLDNAEHSPFRRRPLAQSGGGGWTNLGTGGLVTTASDFYRLLQAILNRGELNGVRLLSPTTADQMFSNQLASTGTPERAPGVGFGLGSAVVTDGARYGVPGSEGLMFWAGSLNTRYWIFPRERLIGIYLTQVEPFPYRDLMNAVMKMSLQATARQPASAAVPLSLERLDVRGVSASTVTHEGREAVRLIEADRTRATGLAVVKGVTLRDGTIELDVAGRRGPYAADDDRGFVGVAFRVASNAAQYEYIYLRPDNGRAEDQTRRNHSTQYASHPEFPWPRLRKESPEKYESYVDLESGAWTHMRLGIEGSTARLFVHGAKQPALIARDLKLAPQEGGVGLWIGAGSEAFFTNLHVTPR